MERPKCNAWQPDTSSYGGTTCLQTAHHFFTLDGVLDPTILFGRCDAHMYLGTGRWRELSEAQLAIMEVHSE